MEKPGILVAWSGGKDCCLMLDGLLAAEDVVVESLVATVNGHGCLRMHGVPEDLLVSQAECLRLPLDRVDLRGSPDYAAGLGAGLKKHVERGVQAIAYGDISNQEVRDWREALHRRFGLRCLFPLWGRDSLALALEIIDSGFKAIVSSVDATRLPHAFAGRPFDRAFLEDLPPGVDPCGENGEFHTFVQDGPRFRHPLPLSVSPPMHVYYEGRAGWDELGVCDLHLQSAGMPSRLAVR